MRGVLTSLVVGVLVATAAWCPSCLSFVGTSSRLMMRDKTCKFNRRCVQRQIRSTTTMRSPSANFALNPATHTSHVRGNSALSVSGGEEEGGNAVEEAVAAETVAVPEKRNLPFFLDPSTRGGAVVVPVLSLLLPLGGYAALTASGVDGNEAGAWVGVAYTLLGLIAWVGSYFFRVATKNMTYAVQLKNYEQAVIEKRFGELEDDEKEALLEEVNEP